MPGLCFTHSRRKAAVLAAAVALVLTAAACDAGDDSSSQADPPKTATGTPSGVRTPTTSAAPGIPPTSARPGTSTAAGTPAATKTPVGPTASTGPGASTGPAKQVVLPPAAADFDYQIGGPYQPPSNVRVVIRDRSTQPESGLYNICYVNGYQAQPDALPWWEKEHPDLLLRKDGKVVMDEAWGEAVLDVSTEAKRVKLAEVVGPWIDDCAHKGFQALEIDNLDSYSRSAGLLTLDQDAAFAQLLVRRGHAAGLAVAQKNTTELADRRAQTGFDFAVAEECGHYDECGAYASAFANRVLVVEYTRADLDKACQGWRGKLSIVLRDRQVSAKGKGDYQYGTC
ncbi:endo alpha-1,4 polygalactosaminidase [Embleya sp. AB8]|uniref:endo alpha-1,4 polygalactosaminidase n=1 Tax=Embleya sp. AB8 TaxID=3156304 RepID=UPI003C7909CF